MNELLLEVVCSYGLHAADHLLLAYVHEYFGCYKLGILPLMLYFICNYYMCRFLVVGDYSNRTVTV